MPTEEHDYNCARCHRPVKPPLTLLEAQTLACLSLGLRLPWQNQRISSQALQRLQRKGFIALSPKLERSMTMAGAFALRQTWEWLLISGKGMR